MTCSPGNVKFRSSNSWQIDPNDISRQDDGCDKAHRKWGGGNAEFEGLGVNPAQADIGPRHATRAGELQSDGSAHPRPRRTKPLPDPGANAAQGLGCMPHSASKVVDEEAVNLIRQWIASLSNETLLDVPGALHPRLPGR